MNAQCGGVARGGDAAREGAGIQAGAAQLSVCRAMDSPPADGPHPGTAPTHTRPPLRALSPAARGPAATHNVTHTPTYADGAGRKVGAPGRRGDAGESIGGQRTSPSCHHSSGVACRVHRRPRILKLSTRDSSPETRGSACGLLLTG